MPDELNQTLERPAQLPTAVKLAISFSIFVLLLGLGEIASYLKLRFRPTRMVSENIKSALFQGAPWTDRYFLEFAASSPTRYHAYTLWRRAPFRGQTINIDNEGLRQTYYSRCEAGIPVIWMFGNSALWGAGNPDWTTIPSLVAQKLTTRGQPVCVRNFGEKAWVSTQEVIALMLQLKRVDTPPTMVIFYDGPSDTYLPYESDEIDVHDNIDKARAKFEDASTSAPGFRYIRKTNTYILLNQFVNNAGRADPLRPVRQVSEEQATAMANRAVENYRKNLDIVDVLGRHYGFMPLYFWQPTVRVGKKPLSYDETQIRQGEERAWPGSESVYRAAYGLMARTRRDNLVNLTDVFEDHPETLFMETNHLGPAGNSLIAERIVKEVVQSGALNSTTHRAIPARPTHASGG